MIADRPPSINVSTWVAPIVTLLDGSQVSSDSDLWRHQCEAQHVLSLPNKLARQKLLSAIEAKRGVVARRELEFTIIKLWKAVQRTAA